MGFTRLPPLTVLDLIGTDAAKILNNLCSAAILNLVSGEGVEAFVTDVRGRTLGHVCVFVFGDRLRLIGAAGQAEQIASHVDRYTIREDVRCQDRSGEWLGVLVDAETLCQVATVVDPEPLVSAAEHVKLVWRPLAPTPAWPNPSGSEMAEQVLAYRVPWTASTPLLLAGPAEAVREWAPAGSAVDWSDDPVVFHRERVTNRFPWYGIDLDDRNLPQEADRDALAISFTKGCYLGQETVARLDALGQVQKKLVRWQIEAAPQPPVGTELRADDRIVGRLTTINAGESPGTWEALGFARRSHFDAGAEATWEVEGVPAARAVVLPGPLRLG
ncbi:MAG: aminomethyltransferase [Planctomycetaceae bacterium]|nr:MAG: aminomethyltransferase [Planctomycetaceae bacterium]